jgi:hypothetical protein
MLQTATKKILVVTRRWPKEVELRIARDYEPRINLADRFYSSDELINVSWLAFCLPPLATPCRVVVGILAEHRERRHPVDSSTSGLAWQ